MRSYIFTAVTAAVAGRLTSGVLALEAPIPGYGVEEFQWEVQAFVDGPKMNLTGTVESVMAQLQKLNPNHAVDFANHTDSDTNIDTRGAPLNKRFGPKCGPSYDWYPANADTIRQGISYLRGVSGTPTNGPGPGNCGRVSCSYYSAIWWCNDNTYTFALPSYSTIADCAQVLTNACQYRPEPDQTLIDVVGQNFNGYNWNCIVRGDRC